MRYAIAVHRNEHTGERFDPPVWLKSYDPDANPEGRGDIVFTDVLSDAQLFDATIEAYAVWTAVPKSRPLRPDGKPNRPFNAFTITVDQVG